MQKTKKFIMFASLIIVLLILAYLFIAAFGIVHFGKSDSKTHSDVAIVLGAATYDGEVSPGEMFSSEMSPRLNAFLKSFKREF